MNAKKKKKKKKKTACKMSYYVWWPNKYVCDPSFNYVMDKIDNSR